MAERMIDQLENKIFELHSTSCGTRQAQMKDMNQSKREDYLDTSYLRNGDIRWGNQLVKMAKHAQNLEDTMFG